MKPELNSDFQKMGELQSAFFSRERRTEGVAFVGYKPHSPRGWEPAHLGQEPNPRSEPDREAWPSER